MASNERDDRNDAQDWEKDWRSGVSTELRESAKANQQTAIILERLNGRLDEHDRRITALEGRPTQAREWFSTANQSLGTIIALIAIIITLLINLLPHLTYHP